jgi:hypothetical protein
MYPVDITAYYSICCIFAYAATIPKTVIKSTVLWYDDGHFVALDDATTKEKT